MHEFHDGTYMMSLFASPLSESLSFLPSYDELNYDEPIDEYILTINDTAAIRGLFYQHGITVCSHSELQYRGER